MTHLVTKEPSYIITIGRGFIFSGLRVLSQSKPFGIELSMVLVIA